MSYYLMVFDTNAAPKTKDAFMPWFKEQTNWKQGYDYHNPTNATSELQSFYNELKQTYPDLTDLPLDSNDDRSELTDYSIGKEMIYMAFTWSVSSKAGFKVIDLAVKHKLGMFDPNGGGEMYLPENGVLTLQE